MSNHYQEIVTEINYFVEEIENYINDKLDTDSQKVIGVLFKRIANGFKSINLLIGNGFYLEALTVMRSVIEARMVLSSVLKSPDGTLEKLKLLAEKNLRQYVENARNHVDEYNEIEVSHLNNKKVGIWNISELNLEHNKFRYNFEYGELCSIVHINKLSLENMLDKINDKIVVAQNITINEVVPWYNHMISEIIITFLEIQDMFQIAINDRLIKLSELSKGLFK